MSIIYCKNWRLKMIPIHKLCSKILKAVDDGGEIYGHVFYDRYGVPPGVLAHAVKLLIKRKLVKYEKFKIKKYE